MILCFTLNRGHSCRAFFTAEYDYEISLTEFPEAQKDTEDEKVRRSDIEKNRLDGKSKLIRTNPRARVL